MNSVTSLLPGSSLFPSGSYLQKYRHLWLLTLVVILASSLSQAADYKMTNDWIQLDDGVKLSVTYYLPNPSDEGVRYPVLLEMTPYRKEDLSKAWSHHLYDYFARQGIALAKVDIRGTGSSEGQVPTREYSEQEIDDAVEVIAHLANRPWSNGNVGMWGISWSGFNSLQVALRNPPALKAILAAHSSDDWFKNDVHYTDGIFGIDEYILSINHMTGFMQSPDYPVNKDYFNNRFDREPWLLETLANGVDNEFWQRGLLDAQYSQLRVPVYLIGGLLDGYRDTLPHMLEKANVPVRAILGPWPHSWPDSSTPGPTWEWREDASRWWHYWLNPSSDKNMGFESNSFRFFQRSGNPGDANLDALSGEWFQSPWPLPAAHTEMLELFPSDDSTLAFDLRQQQTAEITLSRSAGSGIELGEWWGELLPDLAELDGESLVFDSEPFDAPVSILGEAAVDLMAASDADDGQWIVRLEDVSPDGNVALITGGAINGQFRNSSSQAQPMTVNGFHALKIPLRMTSWTFQPGHRMRLALSNAAFPMFWPSPKLRSSRLKIDSEETRLQVPLIKHGTQLQPVLMELSGESSYLPAEAISLGPVDGNPTNSQVVRNEEEGSLSFIRESGLAYKLPNAALETTRHTIHTVNLQNPELTRYQGWAEYGLEKSEANAEKIRYRTEIDLRSDESQFHVEISRTLWSDETELRRKTWQRSLPRGAH